MAVAEQESRQRGRPRPAWAVQRDDAVLKWLEANGPATRNQVAAHFAEQPEGSVRFDGVTLAYNSLDRLHRSGRVRQCVGDGGVVIWSAGKETPCP
jgi:hypothetical protein